MNTEDIKIKLESAAANYIHLAKLLSTLEGSKLAQDPTLIEQLIELRLATAKLAKQIHELGKLGDRGDGTRKRARPVLTLVKR